MKISCIIVDDEPNAVKLLSEYAVIIPQLEVKATCSNAAEALNAIEQFSPQLVFLDINMPGMSGIDLAALVSKKLGIIFTTAYSEYAVTSYDYNAIDYLLKPISLTRFRTAVEKANDFLHNRRTGDNRGAQPTQSFFLKMGHELIKIDFESVLYIEASKEYALLHTAAGKYMYYCRMKEFAKLLPGNFIRVHHSYIVNLTYVTRVETSQLYTGSTCIPISATYKRSWLKAIKDYTLK
jgi:two-component system, LytTR family, response regulator